MKQYNYMEVIHYGLLRLILTLTITRAINYTIEIILSTEGVFQSNDSCNRGLKSNLFHHFSTDLIENISGYLCRNNGNNKNVVQKLH